MAQTPTLLLVEDTPSLANLYVEYLKKEHIQLVHMATGKSALDFIARTPPDLIVLDLQLPDMNGFDVLRHVFEQQLPTIVIVITAHGSINIAVEAMRLGCFDFIVKPFTADRLRITIRNAVDRYRLGRVLNQLRIASDDDRYFGFIGGSHTMQAVYHTIENAAVSKATIFITGESGTGKEVTADAIHRRSPRAANSLVALNCAAIPHNLLESEIFGHVKGAFTGAISDHQGAAKRAHGGTLFLDEICELDLNLQTKLLRFIQSGTFNPVGSTAVESVDVRFVCATNRDPWAEVQAGRFREDLYYRLMVIPVELPPLRERGDDVVLLANYFLQLYAIEEKKRFQGFAPEVLEIFRNYEWQGNVRQLQNTIRQIAVLGDGDTVTASMLPKNMQQLDPGKIAATHVASSTPVVAATIKPLWQTEREAIEDAIAACGGNIPEAAAKLGVSPSTIYRKKMGWESGGQ
jgi:DNA-binding NtrC family response regulator